MRQFDTSKWAKVLREHMPEACATFDCTPACVYGKIAQARKGETPKAIRQLVELCNALNLNPATFFGN